MIGAFDQMVNTFLDRDLFSGVVLLARDGQPIYQRACGYENRSCGQLNKLETRFATASITKMFTAIGVLQLISRGKFELKTSIVNYLGLEDSSISQEVTVEHLLTHTSGIADYFDVEDPNGFENLWNSLGGLLIDRPSKLLPLFIDEPPRGFAGEQFEYNGAGFVLLGLLIEKASNMTYETYITKNIFQKVGMNHSGFIPLNEVVPDVAEGYIPIRDGEHFLLGWKKNIYSVPVFALPDGGIFSTAWDLVYFMKGLREGKLLDGIYLESWLKPKVEVGKNWHYGYGCWFDVEDGVILRYGHTGEDPGVSARVYYYPVFNLDLVILGNQSYCAGEMDWQLHQIILDEAKASIKNSATK